MANLMVFWILVPSFQYDLPSEFVDFPFNSKEDSYAQFTGYSPLKQEIWTLGEI